MIDFETLVAVTTVFFITYIALTCIRYFYDNTFPLKFALFFHTLSIFGLIWLGASLGNIVINPPDNNPYTTRKHEISHFSSVNYNYRNDRGYLEASNKSMNLRDFGLREEDYEIVEKEFFDVHSLGVIYNRKSEFSLEKIEKDVP